MRLEIGTATGAAIKSGDSQLQLAEVAIIRRHRCALQLGTRYFLCNDPSSTTYMTIDLIIYERNAPCMHVTYILLMLQSTVVTSQYHGTSCT